MKQWLSLKDAERRYLLMEVSIRTGIPPVLIEKDWWQTLVLKGLFETPASDFLTLGGSRSLQCS